MYFGLDSDAGSGGFFLLRRYFNCFLTKVASFNIEMIVGNHISNAENTLGHIGDGFLHFLENIIIDIA